MKFLINCSNLKAGGGLQVADSVCCQLGKYPQHHFVVVLSPYMQSTEERLNGLPNVEVAVYEVPNTLKSIVFGRDAFLDSLVKEKNISAVLTVFGPSRWSPRVPHLSGFAMPHLVIPESPYFTQMSLLERVKWFFWCWFRKWSFKKSANYFWTENPFISSRLEKLLGVSSNIESDCSRIVSSKKRKVITVSNYYNQVFDDPQSWRSHPLEPFDGVTCLSVSAYYPHKNFPILVEAARVLRHEHPVFNFRFVLTFDKGLMAVPDEVWEHFVFTGKVDVSECPDLYRQSDIMVMPTLLECFTATYPEAMRMEVPIVTTDLEFARGLCEDAACYYSAVDAKACAEAIYKVATDKEYAEKLVANGKEQLKKFDNYEQRADKLIGILEEMVSENK
mgnify:CR=1 FL=1